MKKLEQKWKEREESTPEAPIKESGQENDERTEENEEQTEEQRDLAMVAALHERLNGLREMEDADRQRAIECIERHQKALEEQQEQLAQLLQSAITYLRAMEPEKEQAPTPPPRGSSICKTDWWVYVI